MSEDLKKPVPGEQFSLAIPNVGANDQVPYTKADLVKACRISGNFALSFYQLDYQALANAFAPGGKQIAADQVHPMPVAKIVLDQDGFKALVNEIHSLQRVIEAINKKGQNAG
jgi:hypothetical protein